jgi:hypothetical protein
LQLYLVTGIGHPARLEHWHENQHLKKHHY